MDILSAIYQKYWDYVRTWISNETNTPPKPPPPKLGKPPTPAIGVTPKTRPKPVPSYRKENIMSKKAFVVGIDKYENPAWDLQGCTMDAAVMSGVLQDHYGFPRYNIRLLLNERATKRNMEKRLDWLVRDAQPGDVLVFFYAGHGSQVRDRNDDELEDHMDEILCPHDLNWDDPLSDDVLASYFNKVPAGVNLTVIFDCCHSGTATRSMYVPVSPDGEIIGKPEYRKTRYLKPPLDIDYRSRGLELPVQRMKERIIEQNHVLIAACTDKQEAQEKRIEGQVRGAFSYYLVQCLKRANWELSYREAHDGTSTRLQDSGFIQNPQLEGPEDYLGKQVFASFSI